MFIEKIKQYLEALPADRDPRKLSISALGKCGRALAYRFHGVPGEPLGWQSLSIFDTGNRVHDQVRGWLGKALDGKSCYKLGGLERDCTLLIDKGVSIGGHVDGLLEHDTSCSDKNHETMLLEVKSMGKYPFELLLKTGELDFGYRCQVSGYLEAMGLSKAIIIAQYKDKGDLHEMVYEKEPALLTQRKSVIKSVLLSQFPEQVVKEYSEDERGYLPWQCGFCDHMKTCYKDFTIKQLLGNHKFRVLMKEEPRCD